MANYPWTSNLLLRRTVTYIFICAFCLGIASASFEFYSIYHQELKRINDNLDEIEHTQVETLANNAWILNHDAIQIQLQSLVQHPDIIYLEFSPPSNTNTNTNTNKIIAGEKPASSDDIISRSIPLYFIDVGEEVPLGVFSMLVSTEPTKNMLFQRIPLIALSETIKNFTLCGLVIWIFYYLFSRHLSQIAKFTNTLDIDKLQNRLSLQRREPHAGTTDELGQIVKAINEMQDRIQEGLHQKKQVETALRKNEELLQFATEGASLGIWDWNLETNEAYFNPIYFTMLGYGADELPHSIATWNDLTHPEDRAMIMDVVTQGISQDKPWKIEYRLRTKNGPYKWIIGSGKVVERDEAGHPLRASGIHLDISETKNLEDERQKVIKLESVGVLAGGIAHDFNNILAAILGNVELASYRVTGDVKTLSLLSSAQKAIKRAAKLTLQLLTFSKGGEPIKEATSLRELVRESADFVLHGSQVSCEYNFPVNLWLVDADSGQLGQVIQNITLNAMHSMLEGGKLKIDCRNIDHTASKTVLTIPNGNFVCISIEDTGSGIPLNIQDKIFDPYFSTKQQGSGLGLAVCHSIIAKHDGYIAVHSVPENGTTFSIYLPATPTFTDIIVEEEPSFIKSPQTAKIMVMDDDKMIRNIVREQLTILGHEVILVMDGEQALAKFQEAQESDSPIDLVIVDLTIPGGMGGQETARKLLKIAPEAKLIVSSGYSNDPVIANFREYGFYAAMAKPFNLDVLRKGIESALA